MGPSDFSYGFFPDFIPRTFTYHYDGCGAIDRMRPLLFHRLLSQHPIFPTPEGSSRLLSRFFTASLAFAFARQARLPFPGHPFDAARFTLCYGLLICSPYSGCYIASAQSVTRLHWMLATGRLSVTRIGLSPISRRQLSRHTDRDWAFY